MPSETKARLAILASGGGSNADRICDYFQDHPEIQISLILSNKKDAGVHTVAANHKILSHSIPNSEWIDGTSVVEFLQANKITHVILAGFLRMIPIALIKAFPNHIINIHPSLLPHYGGKGMYGHHVHEAVHSSKEEITGMSIHLVNEDYDDGEIIFQAQVTIGPEDTPSDIAKNVLRLEHFYYPRVIEAWICGDPMPN